MRIVLVECLKCGHRTWLKPAEVGDLPLVSLSKRLRCSVCRSKTMRLEQAMPVPIVADPLEFKVEHWTDDGNRIEQELARSSHLSIALVAYDEAVRLRPGKHLLLRDGARVVRKPGDTN